MKKAMVIGLLMISGLNLIGCGNNTNKVEQSEQIRQEEEFNERIEKLEKENEELKEKVEEKEESKEEVKKEIKEEVKEEVKKEVKVAPQKAPVKKESVKMVNVDELLEVGMNRTVGINALKARGLKGVLVNGEVLGMIESWSPRGNVPEGTTVSIVVRDEEKYQEQMREEGRQHAFANPDGSDN